jgi:GMP synthase (glutamine-hydrolysing)
MRNESSLPLASSDRPSLEHHALRHMANPPPNPQATRAEVIVLQHVACETIGSIHDALTVRHVSVRSVRTFDGDAVPTNLGTASGLIVMGGPMGVHDHGRFPHLRDEMRLIDRAVRESKPVLGVCLGCQLLAAALGAAVAPSGRQEIGWHRISLAPAASTDPVWLGAVSTFMALHWHGDIFDLPAGAELLASSEMTAHQAFRYGKNAYGLLFHIEATASSLESMAAAFPDDLQKVGLSRAKLMEQSQLHLPALRSVATHVFGRWVEAVVSSAIA